MRSLTRLPRSLRTNKVAVWGGCSCTGRAPGANRLGNCAPRKIGASWTWKVFKKGLKTLPIMPVDRCGGLAGPIGRFYRNPAKTHVFTDSCSEPKVAVAGYGERSDNLPLLTKAPVENMIAAPKNWCLNPSFTSCLRVSGNSMAPLIQDGFVVAVDSSDTDVSKLPGKVVIA